MKVGVLFGVLLVLLLIVPVVSSAVVIEDDFDSKYSVGDRVELSFSVSNTKEVSDFVESYLNCDNDKTLVDKRYIFLDNNRKNFTLEFPVLEEGGCQFEVQFLNNEDVSEDFTVSNKVIIEYEISGKSFFPLEVLNVTGTAKKANGDWYSGVAKVKIGSLTDKLVEVLDGSFSFDYEFKEEASPKEYLFSILVEELDSNEDVINSGRVEEILVVNSKPSSISIKAVDSFQPPYNLSFSLELLNQIETLIENESIIAKFYDAENKLIFQKEVNSSVWENYSFSGTTRKGTIYLNAYYGNIFSSVPIFVEGYEAVDMEVIDNDLKFSNIGNVPYIGGISVYLDGENSTELLINLTLGLGESYLYSLEYLYPVGYSGAYNITSEGKNFLNVPLTGAAILEEGDIKIFSLFIVFFFVILLIYGYFFSRKRRERLDRMAGVEMGIRDEVDYKMKTADRGLQTGGQGRKMRVQENKFENISAKKDVYMVFIKSKQGVESYHGIVSKYGFRFNQVGENLGYVVFYGVNGVSPEYKMYNLSQALRKFGEILGDDLTVVLNKGYFEKKMSLLKKFALVNRKLVDAFDNKLIIGDKVMRFLHANGKRNPKIIEVAGYKLKVWLLE
ncbi:MAG: hypothetical protein PF542_02325 [Nanoarchaeota archaeon]|jgi:hypothetical protein|nr:hypothetical protein [Nanoarchaeota archaeon]